MNQEELQNKAKRKVEKKKGFYIHLGVYMATALFFFAMNLATQNNPNQWWFYYPLIPWGLGLSIHYLVIFGFPGTDILSLKWEKREYEKELEKLELENYRQSNKNQLDLNEPEELELKQVQQVKPRTPKSDEFV